MKIKELLFEQILKTLLEKELDYKGQLHDLFESLQGETKSSAGDKYETSREMIKLEQDKLGSALAVLESQKEAVAKLKEIKPSKKIQAGSLVKLNGEWYFISIGINPITIDGISYRPLAANSPISIALNGKKAGESIVFNGKNWNIEEVI